MSKRYHDTPEEFKTWALLNGWYLSWELEDERCMKLMQTWVTPSGHKYDRKWDIREESEE
jgi:hypothetical protein